MVAFRTLCERTSGVQSVVCRHITPAPSGKAQQPQISASPSYRQALHLRESSEQLARKSTVAWTVGGGVCDIRSSLASAYGINTHHATRATRCSLAEER